MSSRQMQTRPCALDLPSSCELLEGEGVRMETQAGSTTSSLDDLEHAHFEHCAALDDTSTAPPAAVDEYRSFLSSYSSDSAATIVESYEPRVVRQSRQNVKPLFTSSDDGPDGADMLLWKECYRTYGWGCTSSDAESDDGMGEEEGRLRESCEALSNSFRVLDEFDSAMRRRGGRRAVGKRVAREARDPSPVKDQPSDDTLDRMRGSRGPCASGCKRGVPPAAADKCAPAASERTPAAAALSGVAGGSNGLIMIDKEQLTEALKRAVVDGHREVISHAYAHAHAARASEAAGGASGGMWGNVKDRGADHHHHHLPPAIVLPAGAASVATTVEALGCTSACGAWRRKMVWDAFIALMALVCGGAGLIGGYALARHQASSSATIPSGRLLPAPYTGSYVVIHAEQSPGQVTTCPITHDCACGAIDDDNKDLVRMVWSRVKRRINIWGRKLGVVDRKGVCCGACVDA